MKKSASLAATLVIALSVATASAQFTTNAVSGTNPRPQAVSGTNPRPQAVSGTNPRPQAVSGTNPRPQVLSGFGVWFSVMMGVFGL